jgi:hypothetical protein
MGRAAIPVAKGESATLGLTVKVFTDCDGGGFRVRVRV